MNQKKTESYKILYYLISEYNIFKKVSWLTLINDRKSIISSIFTSKRIYSIILFLLLIKILNQWLYIRKYNRIYKEYNIKSQYPLPIFGDIINIILSGGMSNSIESTYKSHEKDGLTYIIWIWSKPIMVTADYKWFTKILKSNYKIYDRNQLEQTSFNDIFGHGLLMENNGQTWREKRKNISLGFKMENLEYGKEIIYNTLTMNYDELDNKIVDIHPFFSKLSFDIISQYILGTSPPSNSYELWEYILKYNQFMFLCPVPFWKFVKTSGYKRYINNLTELKTIIKNSIDNQIDMVDKDNPESDSKSLLYIMLRNLRKEKDNEWSNTEEGLSFRSDVNKNFKLDHVSEEAMIRECLTLLFAGHDTTSILLTYTVYHLASCQRQPEMNRIVQDHEKINSTKQNESNGNFYNKIRHDVDNDNFESLNLFLKEVLRLYSPAPYRGRTLLEDDIIDGIPLYKGQDIILNFDGQHRLNFENGDEFNPERFKVSDDKNWIPFGLGPRECIGKQFALNEAQIVIAEIIKRYQLKLIGNPIIKKELCVTLKNIDPIKIKFINL